MEAQRRKRKQEPEESKSPKLNFVMGRSKQKKTRMQRKDLPSSVQASYSRTEVEGEERRVSGSERKDMIFFFYTAGSY